MTEALDAIAVELRRVVDRLNALPLDRLTGADGLDDRCHAVAVLLADAARSLGGGAPVDVDVPVLQPSGWGAQLAVLGRDYLEVAAKDADSARANTAILAALTDLRRALP